MNMEKRRRLARLCISQAIYAILMQVACMSVSGEAPPWNNPGQPTSVVLGFLGCLAATAEGQLLVRMTQLPEHDDWSELVNMAAAWWRSVEGFAKRCRCRGVDGLTEFCGPVRTQDM